MPDRVVVGSDLPAGDQFDQLHRLGFAVVPRHGDDLDPRAGQFFLLHARGFDLVGDADAPVGVARMAATPSRRVAGHMLSRPLVIQAKFGAVLQQHAVQFMALEKFSSRCCLTSSPAGACANSYSNPGTVVASTTTGEPQRRRGTEAEITCPRISRMATNASLRPARTGVRRDNLGAWLVQFRRDGTGVLTMVTTEPGVDRWLVAAAVAGVGDGAARRSRPAGRRMRA